MKRRYQLSRLGLIAALLTNLLVSHEEAAQSLDDAMASYEQGDFATALREFRLLAEEGDAMAQFKLGRMHGRGEGVPVGDEAVRWYPLTAGQGHAKAQFKLGRMHEDGEGVPEDNAEAVKWFHLAAEQNQAAAQYSLGIMYSLGKGVPENDAEAVKWFRLVAEQGYALAQHNLGFMYANGEGVPRNPVVAYAWFGVAAAQGRTLSLDAKDRVARTMNGTQLAEAEALLIEYWERHVVPFRCKRLV